MGREVLREQLALAQAMRLAQSAKQGYEDWHRELNQRLEPHVTLREI